jgi:predicted aspartyl protease
MGIVHAALILKNTGDVVMFERGLIKERDIRQLAVMSMVDTGAGTLIIDDLTCQQLGLRITDSRRSILTNGMKENCKVTEPVDIHWNDRVTSCRAVVVSGVGEVLLGAIPLEDMDLIVNPARQELAGAHGDEVVCVIK